MPLSTNRHPAAMFEIMADDQAKLTQFYQAVFGWHVEPEGGFNYVKFPIRARALLGGIGQAQKGVVGWAKGITFYLEVPKIDDAFTALITAHGGTIAVPRTEAGGYAFAMFEDPEKNLVGLIETFE